jgi:hypothetical protein
MPISTSSTTSMRGRPEREDQAVSKASFETRSFKNGVKVLVSVQYSTSRYDVLQRARDDQGLRRLLEEDVRKFGLGLPPDDVWIEDRSACVVLCWRRPADRAEVRPPVQRTRQTLTTASGIRRPRYPEDPAAQASGEDVRVADVRCLLSCACVPS